MSNAAPLKLTLFTHGLTVAQRESRFPADAGLIDADAEISLPRADLIVAAPELRTRQTVGDRTVEIDDQLRDLDYGRWAGMSLIDIDQSEVFAWLTNPDFAAHGGESVTQLIERVSRWLEDCAARRGSIVAVTHPAVVRAAIVTALQTPREMFWRIDVGPLTQTRLRHRNGWTLRIGD